MKKQLRTIAFISPIILSTLQLKAQVTTAFNFGVATDYVGWNVAQLFPLTVAHKGDFPINFQTNGTQRMTIMNTTGYVGIRTASPIFPLDVRADGANNVTASGWKAGIHLSNHAALAWDNDGLGNFLFMGHPAFNADHSFYCGLAPGLGLASVPNYVYRIVDIPQPIFTSPNSGDMQFFHWVTIFKPGPFISDADQRFGVNTLRPDNTIEINTPAPTLPVPPPALNPSLGFSTLNGYTLTSTGYSGLRFSDLTSASVPVSPAPSNNVLSLSIDGDVILVPGGGGAITGAHNGATVSTLNPSLIAWGQNVGQAGNPGQLLNNREIPQNQFNIQFIDGAVPIQGLNRISFGQLIPVAQSTKFYVFNNIERVGATFEMDATLVPQPVSLSETSVASRIIGLSDASVTGIAVLGNSNNLISKANIGVAGNALNGVAENIGVMGSVPLNSISSGTAFNYGGYFSATGAGLQNFGIYAGAANGSAANYAGFFNGDIFVSGPISGTGYVLATSDQIFKTNIDSISNAIDIINQLLPKTYFMDTANVYGMRFASTRQYGFVAQDVETILPELVSETTKPAIYDSTNQVMNPAITYKSLNYDAFIAILMKGIQEQQRQIDSLQSQINSCCASNERTQNPNNNQTDVTLTNAESIVLNQNVPNPFAEQTTITYNLPESVQKAQLLFYDATGKLIKAVDLTARGNGQINVFANDLSNGIYSYALVVDGQIADTKRMVKTQ